MEEVNFVIIPVSNKHNDYANKCLNIIKKMNINGAIDDRNMSVAKRIRDNELKNIELIYIVGEKEEEENSLSLRGFKYHKTIYLKNLTKTTNISVKQILFIALCIVIFGMFLFALYVLLTMFSC